MVLFYILYSVQWVVIRPPSMETTQYQNNENKNLKENTTASFITVN
jgi:hypothetical protein